jgi:hypothetical protein
MPNKITMSHVKIAAQLTDAQESMQRFHNEEYTIRVGVWINILLGKMQKVEGNIVTAVEELFAEMDEVFPGGIGLSKVMLLAAAAEILSGNAETILAQASEANTPLFEEEK